jgi:SPX domain protein involved in polyphosphate accumulation
VGAIIRSDVYVESFVRREYKYYVPSWQIAALRQRLLRYMDYDEFCLEMPERQYHVRSIYLDTPHYVFFDEKSAGLRNRKKLRIRSYNDRTPDSRAFLEIKRRIDDSILKERAAIPFEEAERLLEGVPFSSNGSATTAQAALNRFVYFTHSLNLSPSVLVTYEREAFFGKDNPEVRVTFDMNVRSYPRPTLAELFREADLKTFCDPNFILEIKFYERMPYWARQVVRDFHLNRESISKYCHSLASWVPSLRALL